jgi:hypothetical protein
VILCEIVQDIEANVLVCKSQNRQKCSYYCSPQHRRYYPESALIVFSSPAPAPPLRAGCVFGECTRVCLRMRARTLKKLSALVGKRARAEVAPDRWLSCECDDTATCEKIQMAERQNESDFQCWNWDEYTGCVQKLIDHILLTD